MEKETAEFYQPKAGKVESIKLRFIGTTPYLSARIPPGIWCHFPKQGVKEMAFAKKSESTEIFIPPLKHQPIKLRFVGVTGLIQNRMSEKVKQQLLVGAPRKTRAEKLTLKHHPLLEYRSALDIVPTGPTALGMRTMAIKRALSNAAVETAGVSKASVQRLIYIPGEFVPLYGVPMLRMDPMRSSDIARTPDIRTRGHIEKWALEVDISYMVPQLNATSVATLASNAGLLIGLGDSRQEKGKGSNGSFRVVAPGADDAEWDEIVQLGREAQEAAIEEPEFYGPDTADLMQFFLAEANRRAS